MARYEINGGHPLNGTVTISGAKNAAVAILPAALLVSGKCRIENVPNISDVRILMSILDGMGAKIVTPEPGVVEIDCADIHCSEPDQQLVRRMRASYYLMGALLGRFGRAHVALPGGETVVCHVKNTGRCRELLTPDAAVYLERAANPDRRTAYDLIAVEKGDKLINMDAQAPNRVFAEWAHIFDPAARLVKPEFTFGRSRLDFCLQGPQGLHLVEVKGVTLEDGGHALFPDAPTERGVRHLRELASAVALGHRATVFFVIQMAEVTDFAPNDATHPAFGEALRQAVAAGVQAAAYTCRVAPDSIVIDRPVPVIL